MKKIGVSIWTGMGERNLIQSGVIERLGLDYELFHMNSDCSVFPHLLKGDHSFSTTKLDRMLQKISYEVGYHALWNQSGNSTQKKYINKLKSEALFEYRLKHYASLLYLHFRSNKRHDLFRDLCLLRKNSYFANLDAIFTTSTDVAEDQMLMYSSVRKGLPCVSLVHSWDNLPSRGLLPAHPDKLLVWNQPMLEQAVKFHNINPDKCDIVGAPQYYLYRKLSEKSNKKVLKRRFNIQDEQKIITYTCTAKRFFPDEILFLKRFCEFVDSVGSLVIIIRLHPEATPSEYTQNFNLYKNVRFDLPDDGFRAKKAKGIGDIEKTKDFVCLMKNSDVVVNLASTTTLDAIAFDTPVICLKFNMSVLKKSWNAAEKWYQSEHFQDIDNMGAYDSAYDFDEFIKILTDVLNSPEKRKQERLSVVNLIIPDLDTPFLIKNSFKGVFR
jgi:hypothetical protein